ncbi:MAG: GGDEF domain-containing protein [Lachnospiraceae bacterium]|nr:GGDEF domain-containing protein [Lachnospiraceae bacterium]
MKVQEAKSSANFNALEGKANRYSAKGQVTSFLILTAVWLLNVLNIFIIDSRLMNTSYVISFFITVICVLVCKFGGEEKPWVKYVLLFLMVLFTTIIGAFLTYQAVLVLAIPICYSMQYYQRKVVYYTYILSVIGMFISTMFGYFYGLCDANMLVLTTGPMAQYVTEGSSVALFDAVNANPWGTLPLYYVLPRCMILFAITMVGSYAVRASAKKAIHEAKLKRLSETDGMTGLYNKNKYMSMLEKHYPKLERVGVIFWDADGLKKLNDTYGHEVGDTLITSVGLSILEMCSDTKHGYRIGGDEFVLILEHADETEVRHAVEEWKQRFEKMNQQGEAVFHASVGFATGTGAEIEDVIRRADERMYAEKRKHAAAEE